MAHEQKFPPIQAWLMKISNEFPPWFPLSPMWDIVMTLQETLGRYELKADPLNDCWGHSSLPPKPANSGHWTPSKTTSLDGPYSFLLYWSQIHVEFQSYSSRRQSPHLCEASHSTPPQIPPTGYPRYDVWKVTTLPTFSAGIHTGT